MPKAPRPPEPAEPHGVPARAPARAEGSPRKLVDFLESQSDRIARALPRHLTPERLIQVVSTITYRTPRLQQCPAESILAAVIQASTLGLDLAPALGEAYLIPRMDRDRGVMQCHFQPGYRGLAKLARNAGGCAYIKAMLVHEADIFAYRYTPDLEFEHVPHLAHDRGEVTHSYAVAKLPTGGHLIEVLTAEEVEAIHRRSESYLTAQRYGKPESGPWATDRGEMAKKVAVKRLCKSLPMSPELASAIDADDAEYRDPGPGRGRVHAAPRRGVAGLASRLGLDAPAADPGPGRGDEADPDPDPGVAEMTEGADPGGLPGDEATRQGGRE